MNNESFLPALFLVVGVSTSVIALFVLLPYLLDVWLRQTRTAAEEEQERKRSVRYVNGGSFRKRITPRWCLITGILTWGFSVMITTAVLCSLLSPDREVTAHELYIGIAVFTVVWLSAIAGAFRWEYKLHIEPVSRGGTR